MRHVAARMRRRPSPVLFPHFPSSHHNAASSMPNAAGAAAAAKTSAVISRPWPLFGRSMLQSPSEKQIVRLYGRRRGPRSADRVNVWF
jgi:hypothetical protein